jgi:multiple sugar transport system permease protein
MNHKGKRIAFNVLHYIVAGTISFLVIVPFLWMVSTSLKDWGALLSVPIQWIPAKPTLDPYFKVFEVFPFARAFLNSAIVTVSTVLVTLLSASMAAFAFAKLHFKRKEMLFTLYLATMMVPQQVTTIPLFLILKSAGLLDSYTGVVLPALFNAFAVFMLRQHIAGIPNDFIEAARIDGASTFLVYRAVVIPLISASLASLGVITFMAAWNDYFWPLVVLSDRTKLTITLALNQLNGQYSSWYNVLMAGSLLSMIPIIIIYILAQRWMKTGLQLGGLK